MEGIKITLPEVSNTASQIRNYNASLDETLSYVSKLMNDLNAYWHSNTEEMLISKFNGFASKFIQESEVIESYAKFLDETVSKYSSLEDTFTANAANFE